MKGMESLLQDVPLDGSTIKVTSGTWAAGTNVEQDTQEKVHCLAVISGAQTGRRILLGPIPLVIGRSVPASIVIVDGQISRTHCRINLEGHDVVVRDLQSTNGSFVLGNVVTDSATLPIGATLRIGRHILRHEFRRRSDVEADQALWHEEIAHSQEPGSVRIEIDQAKRKQDVAQIVESANFRSLAQELEQLRSD